MSKSINIHEAKTHLSRIVDEVAAGKEFILAKAGRAMARIVPLEPKPRKKKFGVLKGRFTVPVDFNVPLTEDDLAGFEGHS